MIHMVRMLLRKEWVVEVVVAMTHLTSSRLSLVRIPIVLFSLVLIYFCVV